MNTPLTFPSQLKEEILVLKESGFYVRIKDEAFYKVGMVNKDFTDIKENGYVIYNMNSDLFIYNYVPDTTSVKDKLLYAFGEMILMNLFGTHVVFVNKLKDITFEKSSEEKTFTHEEVHKQQVRHEELMMDMSKIKLVGSGIPFKIAKSLQDALETDYSGLVMKIENDEAINLVKTCPTFIELIDFLKTQHLPVFAFWKPSAMFISYCPQEASIKDRMVFTTAKQYVQSLFPNDLNKVEASEMKELPSIEKEQDAEPQQVNQPRKKINAPGKRTVM